MAQLLLWMQGSWVGDMQPGESHHWLGFGGIIKFDDVVEIMASPVTGDPSAPERILQVENIRAEGTPDGSRKVRWDVRNAGSTFIPGYGQTLMILRA